MSNSLLTPKPGELDQSTKLQIEKFFFSFLRLDGPIYTHQSVSIALWMPSIWRSLSCIFFDRHLLLLLLFIPPFFFLWAAVCKSSLEYSSRWQSYGRIWRISATVSLSLESSLRGVEPERRMSRLSSLVVCHHVIFVFPVTSWDYTILCFLGCFSIHIFF